MTRHSKYCLQSGTRFTHEWGEKIHVKSRSQGLNVDLAQPGLEPGTYDPEAKCLPLDHNAKSAKGLLPCLMFLF